MSTLTKLRNAIVHLGDSNKSFWILSALLVVSIATNAYFVQRFYLPQWQSKIHIWFIPAPEARADDHSRGDGSAAVTIIEYGDFQCPYCARLHSVLHELTKTENVRWIFRHYTLNAGHAEAPASANAAECAGKQGRFWEYADALYENHADLGAKAYLRLAETLQLDVVQFQTCMATTTHNATIAAHNAEAEKLEFIGVPTWFVNGKRISGAMSLDQVRKIVYAARSSKH